MTMITGTLQQAVPRQVPKKDGTGVWTFYDLTIDGKKYQTSQAVFNQSVGLVNSQVLAEAINEPRNGYDNWKLMSCLPASSTAQAAVQAPQADVVQMIEQARRAQAAGPVPTQAEKDRNASICRQTACKVAATLLTGDPNLRIDTFIDVAAKIANYMETGAKPSEVAVVQALATDLNATTTDDDIPF